MILAFLSIFEKVGTKNYFKLEVVLKYVRICFLIYILIKLLLVVLQRKPDVTIGLLYFQVFPRERQIS